MLIFHSFCPPRCCRRPIVAPRAASGGTGLASDHFGEFLGHISHLVAFSSHDSQCTMGQDHLFLSEDIDWRRDST